MKCTRKLLPILLSVAIVGCAQITLVPADQVNVRSEIQVVTPIAWSRLNVRHNEIWTVDGTLLQELRFAVGIEDGDSALTSPSQDKMPVFKSGMTPVEIAELVLASLATIGLSEPKMTSLRPATVGGVPGFRFELEMLEKDGLEWRGFAVGAINNEKLYLIIYSGARLHYFDKHRNDVEKVIESVRFL